MAVPSEHPIANACEVEPNPRFNKALFLMWAGSYAPERAYVWAAHFGDAFEAFVDWLDDQKFCGLFTSLEESDYKDAADGLGIPWKDTWPDWDDEDFETVREEAEADLTSIGHTSLTNCEKILGGGPLYIPSYEWGGDEISDEDEIEAVTRASVLECWGHDFLVGDAVWYTDEDGKTGKFTVEGVNGDDLDIEPDNDSGDSWTNIPASEVERFDPAKHRKPQTEHERMRDFFFGKRRGVFLDLTSWRKR